MSVYAEEAFLLNGAINYLMLLCGAHLSGAGIRRWRLLLASGAGALYAVLALLPALAFLRTAPMKLWMLAVMTLAAFGLSRTGVRAGALFALSAACLAGLVLAAAQLAPGGTRILPGGGLYAVRPAGVVFLAALCCCFCRLVLTRSVQHAPQELHALTLHLNGESHPVTALRDTGNTLRDPVTNEQILVADVHALQALLPRAKITAAQLAAPADAMARLSQLYPALRFRLIPYRSVGTASGLLLAVRCAVTETGKPPVTRLTAFSPTPLSDGGRFDALTGGNL